MSELCLLIRLKCEQNGPFISFMSFFDLKQFNFLKHLDEKNAAEVILIP